MNKKRRSSKEEDLIYIGKIISTHGRKGEIRAELLTERIELFKEKEVFYLEKEKRKKEVKLIKIREHKKNLLIEFEELRAIEEAKEWVGGYIAIPPYDFLREANEYKFYEIVGLDVEDNEGKKCGIVEDIKDFSGNYLLLVKSDDKEVLIPFVEEYCLVDKDNKKIIIEKNKWKELNEL